MQAGKMSQVQDSDVQSHEADEKLSLGEAILTQGRGGETQRGLKSRHIQFLSLRRYITIPIVLVLYLGHKILCRSPFAIKIEEIDVITGKKEMDELGALDEEPVAKNWLMKAWYWLA